MGESVELCKSSKLCLARFAKNAEKNYKVKLAELDQALNLAQRGFATLSKNSFLMGESTEFHKSSKLCPVRFAKNSGQNHKGELAELDRAPNSAQ